MTSRRPHLDLRPIAALVFAAGISTGVAEAVVTVSDFGLAAPALGPHDVGYTGTPANEYSLDAGDTCGQSFELPLGGFVEKVYFAYRSFGNNDVDGIVDFTFRLDVNHDGTYEIDQPFTGVDRNNFETSGATSWIEFDLSAQNIFLGGSTPHAIWWNSDQPSGQWVAAPKYDLTDVYPGGTELGLPPSGDMLFVVKVAVDVPVAHNPSPADNAHDVSIATDLGWSAPTLYAPTSYDVYFGTNSNVYANPKSTTVTNHFDPPGDLAYGTPYHWVVDALEDTTNHPGTPWSLTTVPDPEVVYDTIVEQYTAEWTSPPTRSPSSTSTDAPLLGNGDMTVSIGGSPQDVSFYLSKNDLWRMKSMYHEGAPRVFGRLRVQSTDLVGASFHAEQALLDGVTTHSFSKGGLQVQMESWVAASTNLLVVGLLAIEGSANLSLMLETIDRGDGTSSSGSAGNVLWAEKAFETDVEIATKTAAAVRNLDGTTSAFTLLQGQPVTLVLAMESKWKQPDPRAHVQTQASAMTAPAVQALRMTHGQWWDTYWDQSRVQLGNPVLEKAYYQGLYTMGAASRDPDFPPPLFGWTTSHTPMWDGDYHMNYNHVAPFYALYSANRLEQADPQDAPILDFRDRGRWYAENVLSLTNAVLYPVGIGPKGNETTRDAPPYTAPNKLAGGLFFGQKSNAAYATVNMAQRWRCTYDLGYAAKVYPFILDVVDFWEQYLVFTNGEYKIYNDAIHEAHEYSDVNPILTAGLLRNLFDLALDVSTEMGVDADRHPRWQDILDNLSPFSTHTVSGQTVFRYTEVGTDWWSGNTLGIQHIFPGNAIGLDSPSNLVQLALNTVDVMQRWRDPNGSNSFFPAAVRVGYDPLTILAELGTYAADTYPNGFMFNNPHGIENCSTVPNTINEMLCMSHIPAGSEPGLQRLRLFPMWPAAQDARFTDLRAWGAFLVSSRLEQGVVQYVDITSEQGRDCRILNPWPGQTVRVRRNGVLTEIVGGSEFTLATAVGEALNLTPQPAPPGVISWAYWRDNTIGTDGQPDSNGDGDIFVDFIEYALGGAPDDPATPAGLMVASDVPNDRVLLSYRRPIGRPDVLYTIQETRSLNPADWPPLATAPTITDNGDGTETLSYPISSPAFAARFCRLEIALRP